MVTTHPHIPTGIPVFDLVGESESGCPGLPRGRALHLFGAEKSGKTTLALMASAAVCKAGGTVLYLDYMCGFMPDYAESLGVPYMDTDHFMLLQPDSQKDGIKAALVAIREGADLVVFDAIGAPGMEMQTLMDMRSLWGNVLPILVLKAQKSGTAILGLDYEVEGHTIGGKVWEFWSPRRIQVEQITPGVVGYEVVKDTLDRDVPPLGDFTLPTGEER